MKTIDEDELQAILAERLVPELDPRFAARVLALAKLELAPAESPAASVRFRRAIGGALVPALLTSAAGCRTALTLEKAQAAFGGEGSETRAAGAGTPAPDAADQGSPDANSPPAP